MMPAADAWHFCGMMSKSDAMRFESYTPRNTPKSAIATPQTTSDGAYAIHTMNGTAQARPMMFVSMRTDGRFAASLSENLPPSVTPTNAPR